MKQNFSSAGRTCHWAEVLTKAKSGCPRCSEVLVHEQENQKGMCMADAKEGASNKEASACGNARERAAVMYDTNLPKHVHNSIAKCFP